MDWKNIAQPSPPKEQLEAWAPAVEFIKNLCVSLSLDFVEQHATMNGARRFYVYHGKTCLVAADDPMQVEHYLYGFRDARNIPTQGACEAAEAMDEISEGVKHIQVWLDKLDQFIDPLTRERA